MIYTYVVFTCPLEGSRCYSLYDYDLFNEPVDSVAHYTDLSQIIIVGDLNSRCSDRNDFIYSNTMPRVLLDQLEDVVHYTRGECLPKRVNQDTKNEYFWC